MFKLCSTKTQAVRSQNCSKMLKNFEEPVEKIASAVDHFSKNMDRASREIKEPVKKIANAVDHISANKGKTRREIEKLGFWLSLLIKVVGWILCVYVASWCKDATTSYFLVCTYYASIPLSLYFVLRICMDIKMRNG